VEVKKQLDYESELRNSGAAGSSDRQTDRNVSGMQTATNKQNTKAKLSLYLTPCSPVVTICTARFNIQQFYVLPTQYIYVFCKDQRTNSDYFPVRH
jgi:hypothetical protein